VRIEIIKPDHNFSGTDIFIHTSADYDKPEEKSAPLPRTKGKICPVFMKRQEGPAFTTIQQLRHFVLQKCGYGNWRRTRFKFI
jgi:hypothetical protein